MRLLRARDIAVWEGLSHARPLVAGCLPPLHETYRPDRVGDYDELSSTYRMIVDAVAPSSDVLLCETMHSPPKPLQLPRQPMRRGYRCGFPSLCRSRCRNLRSEESIAEGVAAIAHVTNVEAVMLNCSSPDAITYALPLLVQAAPDLTIGVYANGFSDAFRASASDNDPSRRTGSTTRC